MTRWLRPYLFLVAALVFAADRVSKYVIVKSLAEGESLRTIPGIFHITLVLNNGAAFGLFRNGAAFFIAFSIIAIALIMVIIVRSRAMNLLVATSLALTLGGAMGNLVDRLKFGHVIDFFDFRVWPVFNIADTAISIGLALLAYAIIFKRS